ncbi:MAG: hypothetical protein HY349_01340 [Nitrospirae bacterium]|nr:hypothetical protein [Nitrospirota bacterium]
MAGQAKTASAEREKRDRWDRRDPLVDQRQGDRRQKDQRAGERRSGSRRADFCPTCGGELSPTAYCSSCKARVIKIRAMAGR